ncbi:MAG: hypothetical protein JNK64_15510 [Myxococcales bacterium]|nr:hypothetical protein [Myxococcales bacterium]
MTVELPDAVRLAPLATAPRRAWAAAVRPHDAALAEHITASIDALRCTLAADGDTAESDALVSRAARLLRANRARWAPVEAGVTFGFARGVPEQVRTDGATWRRAGAALRARWPLLHLDAHGPGRALVGHLAGLRSLALEGAQTLADVEALVDDPAFADLCWLDLSGTGLGLAAIDRIAACETRLRYLGFEHNPEGSPTAWWTDGDRGRAATGGGVTPPPAWGRRAWLELPPFRCAVLTPELFYPYPDL